MRGLLSEITNIINQNPEKKETSTRITFFPYPASFISRVPYGGKAGMERTISSTRFPEEDAAVNVPSIASRYARIRLSSPQSAGADQRFDTRGLMG
jgi:hypothetical protein